MISIRIQVPQPEKSPLNHKIPYAPADICIIMESERDTHDTTLVQHLSRD